MNRRGLLVAAAWLVVTGVQAEVNSAAARAAPENPGTKKLTFPRGAATPSMECGACHQAIYREYSEGFGSDMAYPSMVYRSRKDPLLRMPGDVFKGASAHAVAGVDPFPIHARDVEEGGKSCNVCHFPKPFAIPDEMEVTITKPAPRQEAEGEGITCASCHLTPEGIIRGPYKVDSPHESVADPRMSTSAMCAYCHAMGRRVPGKQTQTFLEWREDFSKPGLGRQQCQDCHMPRTIRRAAEQPGVPERAVARHLWTGGHSAQRIGSALSLVVLQPVEERARFELHLINIGAGHSVPTGSNRRAVYLRVRVLGAMGKSVANREWMFAPWYGDRPDDRAFLKEDEKRPDKVAAIQADQQGPHEAPVRAGEERVLTWEPALPRGKYKLEAALIYDLNRYNDRALKGDQRELSRIRLPISVKAGR